MIRPRPATVNVHPRIGDIAAADWDRLANPEPATANPFISHAFLMALEDAGAVGARTGWLPQHLAVRGADGRPEAVMPLYVKSHSQGEYVFDHGWAEAYERAGGRYYPKLQSAVPFTPVPGRRLLVGTEPGGEQRMAVLAAAAKELAQSIGASSVHATFLSQPEWDLLAGQGYLRRTDQQFHWQNAGYSTFDDFLTTLASRKRKAVRREREQALSAGLEIRHIRGADIREADWDHFFEFYMDTGSRKWGRPYLNRRFFALLGSAMPDACLLMFAMRAGRPVAGALNVIGGDCLYGRYWGTIEHHPCLHFELCYYQAIEFAIAHGLHRVEAGAQGEHKLARGYLPSTTYSAHWIADAGLRRAVARYLDEERAYVAAASEALTELGPYRKNLEPEG